MQLEQARFERRRLELERQMKELETKHNLLEEERELERKVKRTALEKAAPKQNRTNQQHKASEPERKVQVQFTKVIEELTSLERNNQSKSKQQLSNSSTTSRKELQSTDQRYDKKFQDLVEEVNTKTWIGYKIIED